MTVLVQEVWEERVWAARPMRLVAETPAGAVPWFPRGTRRRMPTAPTGRPRETTRDERPATLLTEREWALVEEAWATSTLQIWPRDAWHSIWVSWRAVGRRGFRTMDLVLDLVLPEGWERPCL